MRWLLLFCLIVGLSAGDADQPPAATAPLSSLLDLDEDDARKALAERGPATINGLIALLDSAEENRLANLLGGLGAIAKAHPETLPRVLSILRASCQRKGYWFMAGVSDATDELAEQAAPLVPDLIRQLERQDDDGLNPVFWSLYHIGEPALPAAERVARFLGGAQQKMALNVLPKLGNGIEPILRSALPDHPWAVLQVIADLRQPSPGILALIPPLLKHTNAAVRAAAITAWCKNSPDDLATVVEAGCRDPAPGVQLAASPYLSHLPDQEAGPLVLILLRSGEPAVVTNALWRMGSLGLPPASTVPVIFPFLRSPVTQQRRAAIRAVGRLVSGLQGGSGFSDRVDEPADGRVQAEAIAALRPLLDDPEPEVVAEAATALGGMGLADQGFRRWLLVHVTDKEDGWTYASLLQRVRLGAAEVPDLLALMTDPEAKRRQMAMYVSPEVTPPDARVIAAVIHGLGDADAGVRGYALNAIGKLGEHAVHAYDAIIARLDDGDRNVSHWAAQTLGRLGDGVIASLRRDLIAKPRKLPFITALGSHGTAAAAAIPDIIAVLGTADGELRTACITALGDIGKGNDAARLAVQPFLGHADTEISTTAVYALLDIGADERCAHALARMNLPASSYATGAVVETLLPWPELVDGFLARHPAALHETVVSDVIAGWQPAVPAIRELILRRADVPVKLLALSGDTGHLPAMRAAKDKARGYGASDLAAYARMLGDPPDHVVKISATDPGRFRPASAWPRVDRRRMKPKGDGHGDGFTEIVVTGVVRLADGSHPKAIRFVGMNDRMLLGKREEREEKRLLYNAMTGRFALFSTVFAAYSSGEGKAEEEGPYQTGRLTTRLIAEGAKPLRVVFYDEMPDVEITVDPAK